MGKLAWAGLAGLLCTPMIAAFAACDDPGAPGGDRRVASAAAPIVEAIDAYRLEDPDGGFVHGGDSVALAGNTLVVGAQCDFYNGKQTGAAYVYAWQDGGGWGTPQQIGPADDPNDPVTECEAGTNCYDSKGAADCTLFGIAVAVSGDKLVVGALGHRHGNNKVPGTAYVFTHEGGQWVQSAELAPPDPSTHPNQGSSALSVAVSGDRAMVGRRHALSQGMVYPYDYNDGGLEYDATKGGCDDNGKPSWKLGEPLTADPTMNKNYYAFGRSVALEGDTAIVGEPGREVGGRAYIFTRAPVSSAGTCTWWTPTPQLQLKPAVGGAFGLSVALSGTTVVVGAPWEYTDPSCTYGSDYTQRGQVYIFDCDDTAFKNCTRQSPLVGDLGCQDGFGTSVAVSGGVVLAGAPGHVGDAGATASGAVYVLARSADGGPWLEQARFQMPSPPPAGVMFGRSVAIAGDAGAPGADAGPTFVGAAGAVFEGDPGGAAAGAAYWFDPSGSLLGSPCDAGAGCLSGNCVAGVCCDAPCGDACMTCTAANSSFGIDGICVPMDEGTPCDANAGVCANGGCVPVSDAGDGSGGGAPVITGSGGGGAGNGETGSGGCGCGVGSPPAGGAAWLGLGLLLAGRRRQRVRAS